MRIKPPPWATDTYNPVAFSRTKGPPAIQGPGTVADDPSATSINADIVAYWPLSEASGTRVDTVGTMDLTDNNTVTQALGPDGVDTAAQFVAANSEFLSRASEATLQTGDVSFTICAWIYADSLPEFDTIVAKDAAGSGNREYNLYFDPNDLRFKMAVFLATDTAASVTASTLGAPATVTWYFVCGWHDAAADTINIQVNNGTADSAATAGAAQAAGAGPFQIGQNNQFATTTRWDGRIAKVLFIKRVLTEAERTFLYENSAQDYPFS